jgi:hypothetical protein
LSIHLNLTVGRNVMQATVLLMCAALSSLGCDNAPADDAPSAPAPGATHHEQAPAPELVPAPTPVAIPSSYPVNFGEAGPSDHSIGAAFHATLMSFFCGHDDVHTSKEIESATYAGAYSGQTGYPPALSATLTWSEP